MQLVVIIPGSKSYGGEFVATKIKLQRIGKKHQPIYRVIVINERKSLSSGNCLDNIGLYNPMTSPKTFTVDTEKLKKWMSNGALPTATVARLLKTAKIA